MEIFKTSSQNSLNNSVHSLKYKLLYFHNISQKRFKHYALLNNRGLIRVKGTDATTYLHNCITNKIKDIEENVLYADFLTNKGRVICDSFIYRVNSGKKNEQEEQEYLVDVDKSLVPFLLKYLKRYKLRSDVHLFNASKNLDVWSIWPSKGESEKEFQKSLSNLGIINVQDPRCPAMGFRIIGRNLENSKVLSDSVKNTEDDYKVRRILNGIPEGPKELIKSQSFPFEANLDFLNGVDYHKGCYIGQELTYRTHKRGTVRKRLMPVQFYKDGESEPENLKVDTKWDKTVQIEPGTKLTPFKTEGQGRIKNIYRDGIYNLGMALVDVNFFQNGQKKSTLFTLNTKDNQKLYAKAFLPEFIDLTKKEEEKEKKSDE